MQFLNYSTENIMRFPSCSESSVFMQKKGLVVQEKGKKIKALIQVI